MKKRQFVPLIVVVLMLSACAVSVTETMIVSPSKEINSNHQAQLHKKFKQLTIKANDGSELYALHKYDKNVTTTLLVLHGNALNLTMQPWFGLLDNLAETPFNVLAIDYRGFGLSDGDASFTHMREDVLAALKEIDEHQNVYLYGLSLGSYLAAESAINEQVKGIIIEGGITNHEEMISLYKSRKMLGAMVDVELDDRLNFNTVERISNVDKPVLVLHGEFDENIPVEMGRSIYKASSHEKSKWVLVEGGNHCDSFHIMGENFLDVIHRFIDETNV